MKSELLAVKFSYTALIQFHRLPLRDKQYVVVLLSRLIEKVENKKAALIDSSSDLPRYRYSNKRISIEFYIDSSLHIPVLLSIWMKTS